MQLYGDIASTGNGQLNVLDGYGTVSITNDTSYVLVTDMIETGQGAAGQLIITDTAYTANINGQNLPLTTEYTRVNGEVATETYYLSSSGAKLDDSTVSSGSVGRSAVYTPASGQRYYWTEGEDFMTTTTDTYSTSAWLGISAFYTPSNEVSSNTVVTKGLQARAGRLHREEQRYEHVQLQRAAIPDEQQCSGQPGAGKLDLVRQDNLYLDADNLYGVRRCLHEQYKGRRSDQSRLHRER